MIKYDEDIESYIIDKDNINRFTINDFESIDAIKFLCSKDGANINLNTKIDVDGFNAACFVAQNNIDPLCLIYLFSKKEFIKPKYTINDTPISIDKKSITEISQSKKCKITVGDKYLLDLDLQLVKNPTITVNTDSSNRITANLNKVSYINNNYISNILINDDTLNLQQDDTDITVDSNNFTLKKLLRDYIITINNKLTSTYYRKLDKEYYINLSDDSELALNSNKVRFKEQYTSVSTNGDIITFNNKSELVVNGQKIFTITPTGFNSLVIINNTSISVRVNNNVPTIHVNGIPLNLDKPSLYINNSIISLVNTGEQYSLLFNGYTLFSIEDSKFALNIGGNKIVAEYTDSTVTTTADESIVSINRNDKEVYINNSVRVLLHDGKYNIALDGTQFEIAKNGIAITNTETNLNILSVSKTSNNYSLSTSGISGTVNLVNKSANIYFSNIGSTSLNYTDHSIDSTYFYNNKKLHLSIEKQNDIRFTVDDFNFSITTSPLNILSNNISLTDNNLFWGTDRPLSGLNIDITKKCKGKNPLQYAIMSCNKDFIYTIFGKEFEVPILFGRGGKNTSSNNSVEYNYYSKREAVSDTDQPDIIKNKNGKEEKNYITGMISINSDTDIEITPKDIFDASSQKYADILIALGDAKKKSSDEYIYNGPWYYTDDDETVFNKYRFTPLMMATQAQCYQSIEYILSKICTCTNCTDCSKCGCKEAITQEHKKITDDNSSKRSAIQIAIDNEDDVAQEIFNNHLNPKKPDEPEVYSKLIFTTDLFPINTDTSGIPDEPEQPETPVTPDPEPEPEPDPEPKPEPDPEPEEPTETNKLIFVTPLFPIETDISNAVNSNPSIKTDYNLIYSDN